MTRRLLALAALAATIALVGCGGPEPAAPSGPDADPIPRKTPAQAVLAPGQTRAPLLNDTPGHRPGSPELEHAARVFFTSYASFIYGHRSTVGAATSTLTSELLAQGPVPGMERFTPVLIQLRVTALRRHRASVLAQFDDGRGPSQRPEIPATFTRQSDDTWLADAVAEEGME